MKITSDTPTQPASTLDPQKQAKLTDAAQQFEAMMLQEMLKPMRSSQGSWGGDDATDESSDSDTMTSFGTEAFAKAISQGGGFGIAKQVISQVSHEHQKAAAGRSPGTKV